MACFFSKSLFFPKDFVGLVGLKDPCYKAQHLGVFWPVSLEDLLSPKGERV